MHVFSENDPYEGILVKPTKKEQDGKMGLAVYLHGGPHGASTCRLV